MNNEMSAFEQAKVNFRNFFDATERERSELIVRATAKELRGLDATEERERCAVLKGRMEAFRLGLHALASIERETR